MSLWGAGHRTAIFRDDRKLIDIKPELDPDVDDEAPTGGELTPYDEVHLVTYLRLLDADRDGVPWDEAARVILHRDVRKNPHRTKRCWRSHLNRARWMTETGYRHLLA